jgi:hypothetical protein
MYQPEPGISYKPPDLSLWLMTEGLRRPAADWALFALILLLDGQ